MTVRSLSGCAFTAIGFSRHAIAVSKQTRLPSMFVNGNSALSIGALSAIFAPFSRSMGSVLWASIRMDWQVAEGGAVFTSETRRINMIEDAVGEVQHKLRDQWHRQLHALSGSVAQGRRPATGLAIPYGKVGDAVKLFQTASTEAHAVMNGTAPSSAYYGKKTAWLAECIVPLVSSADRCKIGITWCGIAKEFRWPSNARQPPQRPARRLGWPETGDT
ncbi:infB [Symbiodinium sp. CCMP2456]|nr:infB [Symbiodinium sp. CCMP2456]